MAKAGQHPLGMLDVEENPREVRLVPDAYQPAVQHAQLPIAREKARNQEHRPAVSMGQPAAAKDWIAQERRQFAQGKRIPELHGMRW